MPSMRSHENNHQVEALPPMAEAKECDIYARPAWQSRAACLDTHPSLFFPTGKGAELHQASKLAKAVCRGCCVRLDCLEAALDRGEKFGIWGGLTPKERQDIRRLRMVRETFLMDIEHSLKEQSPNS